MLCRRNRDIFLCKIYSSPTAFNCCPSSLHNTNLRERKTRVIGKGIKVARNGEINGGFDRKSPISSMPFASENSISEVSFFQTLLMLFKIQVPWNKIAVIENVGATESFCQNCTPWSSPTIGLTNLAEIDPLASLPKLQFLSLLDQQYNEKTQLPFVCYPQVEVIACSGLQESKTKVSIRNLLFQCSTAV
ncbi:hypothetical protein SASPL_120435 [Salvia splendens]|uniref:Uncharacterized protein n=1 Tax=Salvia splendens TaxID=180675 RepID=A0A8X8XSI2_SALSN|nr:hypothetical protein SASPL_120435 [Salvia splendens]